MCSLESGGGRFRRGRPAKLGLVRFAGGKGVMLTLNPRDCETAPNPNDCGADPKLVGASFHNQSVLRRRHLRPLQKRKIEKMSFDKLFCQPFRLGLWSIHDEKWLECFRNNYSFYEIKRVTNRSSELAQNSERSSVIPRVFHHIWLGSEFPQHFQDLRRVQRCYYYIAVLFLI